MGISKVRACHPILLQRSLAKWSRALGCVYQDERAVEGERVTQQERQARADSSHLHICCQQCEAAAGMPLSPELLRATAQPYCGFWKVTTLARKTILFKGGGTSSSEDSIGDKNLGRLLVQSGDGPGSFAS